MAYRLSYWEEKDPVTHYELKCVRLKSIEEAYSLALPHNRPKRCDLVLLERDRNYKGRKWIDEKTVWARGMENPNDVIKRPQKTKR